MWHGVKAALSESVGLDQPRRNSPIHLDPTAIHWSESMAKPLLSPPSHPEMLGRLGRYEVERLIGSGGMGVVFKAFDTELNRPVAIKLLAPIWQAADRHESDSHAKPARPPLSYINTWCPYTMLRRNVNHHSS